MQFMGQSIDTYISSGRPADPPFGRPFFIQAELLSNVGWAQRGPRGPVHRRCAGERQLVLDGYEGGTICSCR